MQIYFRLISQLMVGLTLLLFSGTQVVLGQDLTGKPRVFDGDTLEISGQLVRLAGVDAPPVDARCGLPGHTWRCGQEATFALAFAVAEHWVTCSPQGQYATGIIVARCKVGPYDLSERMVTEGWAMAVGGYGFAESLARRERRGIWRDGYVPPPGWGATP